MGVDMDTADTEATVDTVDTEARGRLRPRLTVDTDMVDTADTEATVDTVDITVARGRLRLTVDMVDMEAMDMAAATDTDVVTDTTDKQIFHQHKSVRVLDTHRFHIFYR